MVKEGYKKTELGEIPVEWEVKKIEDITEFVGSGVTPRGGQSVYKTNGIPFIRSQNVYPEGLRLDDVVYIDEVQNQKMKRTEFKENDVLLNITGASIGRCTTVPKGVGKGNVNQHVCIIRLLKNTDSHYISFFINSDRGKKQIDSYNGGSSREGLNFKQVGGIKIIIPPPPEQQKIASILSTVDQHIEEIDSLIEKTKELKKGLMQKLLTKGIGHTEFKKTEVGEIPVEWEVNKLSKICTNITIGLVKTMTKNYVERGVPLIRNSDIKDCKINKEKLIYLDKCFSQQNEEKRLKKGDIVTVHTGDIGTSAVIDEELDGCHGFATLNTTVNKNIIYENYLCRFFNSEKFIRQALSFSTGDGRNNLNLKDFVNTNITYPKNIAEQKQIVDILSSIDGKIFQYETKKGKLQYLKKGLMQQLLTGKKRVI
ncbi:restriction endonuclease subunit S [Vallitalea sediminicola]